MHNVWTSIIEDHIMDQLFLEQNLNGDSYLILFQNLSVTERFIFNWRNLQWFQQDETTLHFSLNVRQYIDFA